MKCEGLKRSGDKCRKNARQGKQTCADHADQEAQTESTEISQAGHISYSLGHPKKAAMLKAYMECANVSKACEAAQIGRQTHYDWMASDAEYAAAFKSAGPVAARVLEDEAVRRAREGWDEPVYYQGNRVGVVRKYSDTLLIFLLKGALPAKYTERHQIQSESRIQVKPEEIEQLDVLNDEELDHYIALKRKVSEPGSRSGTQTDPGSQQVH